MGSFVSNLLEPTALTIVVAITTTWWKESVFGVIQYKCGKILTRITPSTDTFYTVNKNKEADKKSVMQTVKIYFISWMVVAWKVYLIFCVIWYQLCSFENVKNTHGWVLLSAKLQAFTIKSITPPWVPFTFLKLCKWYQITQSVSFFLSFRNVSQGLSLKKYFQKFCKIHRRTPVMESLFKVADWMLLKWDSTQVFPWAF